MCLSKVFQGILDEHGDSVCAKAMEILCQADEHFSDPAQTEFHILLFCKSGNHRSMGSSTKNPSLHAFLKANRKPIHPFMLPASQAARPPTHPPTHPPIQTCGIHGRRHVPTVTLAADQCTIL